MSARVDPFADINRLQDVIAAEDDRTVVLLAAAFLEDLLGRLLAVFLMDVKAAKDLLGGYDAPLGTFSARIRAAFAMGLLTDVQHADVDLVRKIRNEMAHSWEKVDIQAPAVRDRIRLLSDTRLPNNPGEKARNLSERLRQCIVCTIIEIEVLIVQMEKHGKRLTTIATHLVAGPAISSS